VLTQIGSFSWGVESWYVFVKQEVSFAFFKEVFSFGSVSLEIYWEPLPWLAHLERVALVGGLCVGSGVVLHHLLRRLLLRHLLLRHLL